MVRELSEGCDLKTGVKHSWTYGGAFLQKLQLMVYEDTFRHLGEIHLTKSLGIYDVGMWF